MKRSLICVVIVMTSGLLPHRSFAQGTDVGISGVGLLSVQPIDDSYVGSPYLSEGIGGIAPGFGAGLGVIFSSGLVVAGEYSTARFEREQYGRLVGGGFPNDGIPHTTRLHDSLVSGLIGYATSGADTRVVVLGGLSAKLDNPTINDEPREPYESEDKKGLPVVLTGGVDLFHALGSRASLVIGARYSLVDRPENHIYLGIGPHVLRVTAGVRVRLN
jgi:hypothetical protein